MARLFTCGFEENNTTTTMWTGGGGTITSTSPHSGTYAANLTAGQQLNRNLSATKTTGTLWTRFYWKTSVLTTANNFARFLNSGGSANWTLTKTNTGAITLTNNVTTTAVTTTATVSTGTWYRIEVEHVIDNTTGSIVAKLYTGDESTVIETLTISGEDTLNTDVFTLRLLEASGGATVFNYDDVAVNDESGSLQNTWPGPGKTYLLTPNGDNAVAWTKAGTPAATNWQGVDEVPGDLANIDTDYNYDSGSTNEDRLNLTNLGAEVTSNAVLALMDVYARVSASASSGTMALKVWNDGGTGTEGPTLTVNSTTWRILTTAEHQVYSLSGVSKATVDSYSAGYIAKSGAVEKRVSALWANVEWIEAPPEVALSGSAATGGHGTTAPVFEIPL